MIISAAHDFGFIHIPKCAGSTIRQQLREKDDLGERFYHTMTLPDLGRINGNHVPLARLESHFPEDLARLRAVTSYAIVREPSERFISSVAQYLRTHLREPSELSPREILDATHDIVAQIKADPDQRDIRNTIFFRQVDYVYLHGQKVIDHVYAMDNMDALLARLAREHDLELRGDTDLHPTVTYRVSGLSRVLKRLNGAARGLLPRGAYMAVRDFGIRTLTTKGAPVLDSTLNEAREIKAFVDAHYADDLALYRAATAGD